MNAIEAAAAEILARFVEQDEYYNDNLACVAAILRKHLPAWQPIETAPRDGKLTLLYCGSGSVRVGYYSRRYDRWFEGIDSQTISPNHWQPLPPPPAGGE